MARPVHSMIPLLGSLLLVGCATAAALRPLAMTVGRNIVRAAMGNYGSDYGDVVEDFFESLKGMVPDLTQHPTPPLVAGVDEAAVEAPLQMTSTDPLEVEFELVREVVVDGRSTLARMPDGVVLRDGRGDPEAGDAFKILVRPRQECWLYLVSIDASGWIQPLFPFGFVPGSNPMAADREVQVPSEDQWFHLDEVRGVETIYLLARRTRAVAFEEALQRLADRPRPAGTLPSSRVEVPDVLSRGIAGVRAGRATRVAPTHGGGSVEIRPASFFANTQDGDLLLTRWFQHE